VQPRISSTKSIAVIIAGLWRSAGPDGCAGVGSAAIGFPCGGRVSLEAIVGRGLSRQ
jgi:hypothetical protein